MLMMLRPDMVSRTPSPVRVAVVALAALGLGACGTTLSVDPASTQTAGPGATDSTIAPTTSGPDTTAWGTIVATDEEIAQQTAALDAAVKRWAEQGITDYSFRLQNNCFCAPDYVGPIDIVVVDGAAVSMTIGPETYDTAWAGSTVPTQTASWIDGTAEQLFDRIRDALGQKDFEATYDPVTGFPSRFYSDPEPMAVDDEYGFTTTGFTVTPGG